MRNRPEGRPRSRIFVVLRLDDYPGAQIDKVELVTATKAFEDQGEAEAEADRLNALNGAKGARYFVRLARLQP
jgi:hypothetical protein